jgi:hypothetical protein
MFPEQDRTIPVAQGYVKKWLVLAGLVGSVTPLALVGLIWYSRFDWGLALGVATPAIVLSSVLYVTYERGLKQAIHLFPNKIVFDYVTYKQEFAFDSADEWTVAEQGDNWKIIALKDHSSKLVPKSAFPEFRSVIETVGRAMKPRAPELWR